MFQVCVYWYSYVSHDQPPDKCLPSPLTNTSWFYVDEINTTKAKVNANSQSYHDWFSKARFNSSVCRKIPFFVHLRNIIFYSSTCVGFVSAAALCLSRAPALINQTWHCSARRLVAQPSPTCFSLVSVLFKGVINTGCSLRLAPTWLHDIWLSSTNKL